MKNLNLSLISSNTTSCTFLQPSSPLQIRLPMLLPHNPQSCLHQHLSFDIENGHPTCQVLGGFSDVPTEQQRLAHSTPLKLTVFLRVTGQRSLILLSISEAQNIRSIAVRDSQLFRRKTSTALLRSPSVAGCTLDETQDWDSGER